MNFLEIIMKIFGAIIKSAIEIVPASLLDLIVFMLGALIIEGASRLILFFVWEKNLSDLSSDLIEKDMYREFTKSSCIEISANDYFNKHNNFMKELTYFIFTTFIIFVGIYLESVFAIGLFFTIRTSRNIMTNLKINLIAMEKVKTKVFDEKEIYYNILISNEYEFSQFFKSSEPGLVEELAVLELKFKELVARNQIDKELAFSIIKSQKIDSTIRNLIDSKYSQVITSN